MHLSRRWQFAFLVASLAGLPAPAGALITVGSLELPTPGMSIVVEDGLAYVGTNWAGLIIADVSDPSAPVEIGSIAYPRAAIRGVTIVGKLAYLAIAESDRDYTGRRPGSLRIVDISDPTAPVEVGAFEVFHQATAIAVVGGLAYLTFDSFPSRSPDRVIEPSSLHIIDVAAPSAPVEVGYIEFVGRPKEIEMLGDFAYIADSFGLRTIDVSAPTAPVETDLATSHGATVGLTIVDDLAYVANAVSSISKGGLSVFDLSDPKVPTEVAFLELTNGAFDVVVEGELAYVGAVESGLWAIDVSDPKAPVALGRLVTQFWVAGKLTVTDGLAYVLQRYANAPPGILQIIDLSIPTTPLEVGTIKVSGLGRNAEVAGGHAYLSVGEDGLRIIDVSNSDTPIEIGAIDTPDLPQDIKVVNNVAYVADRDSGLRIIDVADPTAPIEIAAIDTPGTAENVEVVGDLAFVADGPSGLRVIDVSDTTAPVEIGAIETLFYAADVAVVGELAYVAAGRSLRIIDISNPEEPVEIAFLVLLPGFSSIGIAVSGELVYLAGYGGLRIVDVSDPERPVELGGFRFPEYPLDATSVTVVGKIAYLSGQHVHAIDVSDPAAPFEAGAFNADSVRFFGPTTDVVIAGGLVYAVTPAPDRFPNLPRTVLMIVDFGPEYAPKITVSIDIKGGDNAGSINSASRGVIPVAILGSESFDVADIDLTTLTFGPDGASPAHRRGGHPEDVNDDGVMDLVSHFRTQDTGMASDEEQICISGKMLNGDVFEGCSAI